MNGTDNEQLTDTVDQNINKTGLPDPFSCTKSILNQK